ncbi:hypothetical protein JZX86_25790 [Agrobacterium rosae]|uniref:hypothetical protein n=1 Tax=Agrobacterium rosae TaxID=1972867 RepID=UPI0019D366C4|nr:hypothetical protein [Agrobacterium rosae]MBN7808745.1 hypothetical protein [Agrobacterium rosae]
MTTALKWDDLGGGKEMLDWFGGKHRFHDALLKEVVLAANGNGSLGISTFITTDKTDEKGFLISEKHAEVILTLRGIKTVNITDLDMMPGIILSLDISLYKIDWWASYGVNGTILAAHLEFKLMPKSG